MVDAVLAAARDLGVDLVVPVTDDTVLPLAAARSRFAGVCALALPDDDRMAVVNDKLRTAHLAQDLGIPVPRTALVTSAEPDGTQAAGTEASGLGWPVVVKPQMSRVYSPGGGIEAFTAGYASTPDELRTRVRSVAGRVPVVVQEYCPGAGVGVEVLADRGRVLAAFQHRRLREMPPSGGASSLRESTALDPVLYGHARRLLEALEWTGLAMVEFKVGEDGPRLLEINGRIWGSLPLAVRAGMDFPARLADLCLDPGGSANGPPDSSYTVGVRSRDLELELRWIGTVLGGRPPVAALPLPPRRAALGVGLQLLAPAQGYDVLSRGDVGPGVAEVATLLAQGARAAARRVRGGRAPGFAARGAPQPT